MKASFGGDLPVKSSEITNGGFGCKAVDNAAGNILVVKRGECTYLQKAEKAEESGAAVLVVVNHDNGDLFQLPSGYDLSKKDLEDLPEIPVVLVQQAAAAMLEKLEDLDPFAKAILIPQDCSEDGCFPVFKSDKNFISHFDGSGGEIFLPDSNGGADIKMEFVSSSFGITVPDGGELVLSSPLDSCNAGENGSGENEDATMNGKVGEFGWAGWGGGGGWRHLRGPDALPPDVHVVVLVWDSSGVGHGALLRLDRFGRAH